MIVLSGTTSVGTASSIALLLGLAQGAGTSTLFASILGRTHPALHDLHPVARRFGRHAGSATVAWIAAHAIYGITVGAVYAAATRYGRRRARCPLLLASANFRGAPVPGGVPQLPGPFRSPSWRRSGRFVSSRPDDVPKLGLGADSWSPGGWRPASEVHVLLSSDMDGSFLDGQFHFTTAHRFP